MGMKETDAKVDYNSHQLLLYVEKNNGDYGPFQTGSYLTKNYVDDFWDKQNKFVLDARKKLVDGQISPIRYFMLLIDISEAELATRIGISVKEVRKHQDLAHFDRISVALLRKYAAIFDVPLADFFQIPVVSDNGLLCKHEKTMNPFFTMASIVEEKK